MDLLDTRMPPRLPSLQLVNTTRVFTTMENAPSMISHYAVTLRQEMSFQAVICQLLCGFPADRPLAMLHLADVGKQG
jgi:hypothetical protein